MVEKQTKYSKEQLIKAYSLYKKKTAMKEVAEEVNIPFKSLYVLMRNIDDYISGRKKITNAISPTYKGVVVHFTNNNTTQQPEAIKDEVAELSEKLEEAFNVFQKAIADLVVGLADKRTANIVKAKEKQLSEQKEKYEQELLRLQTIIASAKDSSIIGMIQRKWQSNGGGADIRT